MPLKRFTLWLHSGFSLVEVTIALGIVSFAFVTLLGLMPVGLNVMRQAMDSTTEGMIVQQLAGQARMGAFTNLTTVYGIPSNVRVFYCNEDGSGLTNSYPANPSIAPHFKIYTSVLASTYPGSTVTTLSPISSNLMTLHIGIAVAPGKTSVAKSTNFYNVIIPNSGN